ncbi:MAG: hypothetical protein WD896_00230 [Parcubacteria group bacterium]
MLLVVAQLLIGILAIVVGLIGWTMPMSFDYTQTSSNYRVGVKVLTMFGSLGVILVGVILVGAFLAQVRFVSSKE